MKWSPRYVFSASILTISYVPNICPGSMSTERFHLLLQKVRLPLKRNRVTPSVASEKASPHQTFPLGVAPISILISTQHPPSFTVSPPPFFVMSTPHHHFHHLTIFAKSQSVPPHLGANRFVAAPHWGSGG